MSSNDAWISNLLSLKPDFEVGAVRSPDLRMYMFQGNAYQQAEVRFDLMKEAEEYTFRGLRVFDGFSWNIDNKTPAPTLIDVQFCEDRNAGHRFCETAYAAGISVAEYLPWASDYIPGIVNFMPQAVWVDAIFRVVKIGRVLADSVSSPSVRASRRERAVIVADALARLPADYRDVIVMRHFEGTAFPEIAAKMGRSSGAVSMLWARGLERLRSELENLS